MTLVLLNIEILVLDHVWIIFFHRNFERVPPCSDREWGYSGPDQQAAGRGGELCQPVPHARTRRTITSWVDLICQMNWKTTQHLNILQNFTKDVDFVIMMFLNNKRNDSSFSENAILKSYFDICMQRISQLEFSYQKICLDFLLKTFVFVIFFFFYWLKFDNAAGIFIPNFHHMDQKLSCWTIPRVKMCFIIVRWFVFGECFYFLCEYLHPYLQFCDS